MEYFERTFAALPVGANKTDRLFTEDKLLTNAAIKVVFPVPAYPFNKKILPVLIDVVKSEINSTIFFCSLVKL